MKTFGYLLVLKQNLGKAVISFAYCSSPKRKALIFFGGGGDFSFRIFFSSADRHKLFSLALESKTFEAFFWFVFMSDFGNFGFASLRFPSLFGSKLFFTCGGDQNAFLICVWC